MALFAALATAVGLLAAAGVAYSVARRREDRPDRILCLLYHRLVTREQYDVISPATERRFSIPEESFRSQMHYLRDHGYHPVTAAAVLERVERGATLPGRAVLISFDDGCESVYSRALPILRELGFPALLFITTSPDAPVFHEGNAAQRRVTPDEIRALDAAGVAIGSHGVTHQPLEAMTEEEIETELGESKRILEEILGKPVDALGVPLNWYGRRVRRVAERLGYRAVFTSDSGTIHGSSDPHHLPRLAVEGFATIEGFERSLGAGAIVQRRIVATAKRIPARLLGARIWMPLRERLLASPLRHLVSLRVLERALAAGAAGLIVAIGLAVYALLR